jgi:multimeric flavodoxin WrbA
MDASTIRVLAINGSTQLGDETTILLRHTLREIELDGLQTELIELSGEQIHDCLACHECSSSRNGQCKQTDDTGNALIRKMAEADGILLGSPAQAEGVGREMKALLDRACMVAKTNGMIFRHKVGATVVTMRRAGSVQAFDSLNRFFLINEMLVAGSTYWETGIGSDAGESALDPQGISRMRALGRNMAWLLESTHGQKAVGESLEIVSQ